MTLGVFLQTISKMAYTFSNIFSFEYIDSDSSIPFVSVVYCDVTVLKDICPEIKTGMKLKDLYVNIEKGTMTFYLDEQYSRSVVVSFQ